MPFIVQIDTVELPNKGHPTLGRETIPYRSSLCYGYSVRYKLEQIKCSLFEKTASYWESPLLKVTLYSHDLTMNKHIIQ